MSFTGSHFHARLQCTAFLILHLYHSKRFYFNETEQIFCFVAVVFVLITAQNSVIILLLLRLDHSASRLSDWWGIKFFSSASKGCRFVGLLTDFACLFQLQRYPLEDEAGMQSQSADCEPPPPPPHGSYTNLFDTSNDMPLGGSAHNMQRVNHITGGASLGGAASAESRGGAAGRISPGSQRSGQAPMAVPDQFSPSDPSPVNMYPGAMQQPPPQQKAAYMRNSPSAERSLASDAKYPTTQALITDKGKAASGVVPQPVGAKRSSSQGSLNKQSRGTRTVDAAPAPPQPQPRYTLNHQLGGSGDNHHHHYPAAAGPPQPHKVQTVVKYKESGYSSSSTNASSNTALTGGAAPVPAPRHHHHHPYAPPVTSVKPLPAAPAELDNVPGAVRRPMSFVKAVELSDAIASQEREREKQVAAQKQHGRSPTSQPPALATTTEERHNVYGSTYEISV